MPSVDVATEPKPSSTTLYKSDDELKHNDAEKDSDEESFHLLLDGDDPPDSPKPKTNCDSDANSTSREESKTVDGAENTKTTEAEITADWRKAPPVIIPPKDQDKRKSTEDDLLDISIIRDADEDNASAIAEEKDSQISEAESSDADAPPEAEPEPETEPEPNPDPNDPKPTETENDIEVEVEPDPPQEPGKGEKETTKRGIEEVEAEAPDTNKKIKLEKVDIKQEPKSEVLNALGSFAHYMLSKKMKDLLTISDLEQFVAQKFVEAIRHKTELGELHQTIKKQEYSIETLRKEVLQLAKQNRDLEIVNRKLMTELRAQNGSKKPLVPLKITRSVGLQVKMNLQEVGKRKPGSLGKAASPIVKKTSPQPIAPNLTKKASPLKPAAPLLSQALRTQNRASPSKKTGSKPKPGNFIDLTDEDDKNVKNQNQIKLTYNTINTVQLGNKTLPVVNQMKNRTVALPGVRLASPMKNGKLTIPASVVSTAANGGALMYVVPNTVIASSQLIKFQPNGLLNGPINGSPLTLAPKGSTIQFKQVGSGGRLLAPLVHPAPLPAPPVNASNPHLKPIPPKPHLSIRKTDTGIILQWKMPYDLDMYETIASYQLYAYQETNATPSTDMWRRVGDVKALALPMACTLTQFADKNKYYFAVRSVDVHKRIGAFSDPEEISL